MKRKSMRIPGDLLPDVKVRAFEKYEERIMNDLPGDRDSDWLKAENEILEEIDGDKKKRY